MLSTAILSLHVCWAAALVLSLIVMSNGAKGADTYLCFKLCELFVNRHQRYFSTRFRRYPRIQKGQCPIMAHPFNC